MYSVGLDYHQNRSSLHILDPQGARFKALEVKGAWPKLLEVIDRQVPRPFTICFEASCGYGPLYDQLAQRAGSVQVAHPGELHTIFRSKKKHDRIDAAKIAKILYLDLVPRVHVPRTDIRQWRALIEFRRRLLGRRAALKVQLRALCRGLGLVDLPPGKKLFTHQGLAQLQALALPEVSALQRDLLLEQLASLQDQQQRVEQELARIAQQHPQMQLLMSIPGVGLRTAEAYLAYVDDVRRFRKVSQVGAYFGMVPCEDSSADTRRLGHITKDGPATVRWLICEAAWQGVRRSPTIRAYHARIMKQDPDRRKIALVATGHYLLRVMAAMLRSGELWRESVSQEDLAPLPQTTQQPGPTPKDRPRRLLHGGARVASQQSPILRVEESKLPQSFAGANVRETGEPSTTQPN
jgi:transposase